MFALAASAKECGLNHKETHGRFGGTYLKCGQSGDGEELIFLIKHKSQVVIRKRNTVVSKLGKNAQPQPL